MGGGHPRCQGFTKHWLPRAGPACGSWGTIALFSWIHHVRQEGAPLPQRIPGFRRRAHQQINRQGAGVDEPGETSPTRSARRCGQHTLPEKHRISAELPQRSRPTSADRSRLNSGSVTAARSSVDDGSHRVSPSPRPPGRERGRRSVQSGERLGRHAGSRWRALPGARQLPCTVRHQYTWSKAPRIRDGRHPGDIPPVPGGAKRWCTSDGLDPSA